MRGCIDAKRSFALAVAVGLVGASSASAATQLGETFDPTASSCAPLTRIQTASPSGQYAAPFAGVITSWSFLASSSPPSQIKLKVARAAGGSNYTFVADSALETPAASQLATFPTRIPVEAGDLIGTRITAGGDCLGTGNAAHVMRNFTGDPAPGTTVSADGTSGSIRVDVSAALEPDADNDGFGDETQDSCPTDRLKARRLRPARHHDHHRPQGEDEEEEGDVRVHAPTSARRRPSSARSTAAPFASCTSPLTVKGKKGKNTFAVRAKDAAGNVDADAGDLRLEGQEEEEVTATRSWRYRFGTDRYVHVSRSSRSVDASDDLDAHGHIDALNLSAGGRKVAGSNPVAPISSLRLSGILAGAGCCRVAAGASDTRRRGGLWNWAEANASVEMGSQICEYRSRSRQTARAGKATRGAHEHQPPFSSAPPATRGRHCRHGMRIGSDRAFSCRGRSANRRDVHSGEQLRARPYYCSVRSPGGGYAAPFAGVITSWSFEVRLPLFLRGSGSRWRDM